MLRTENLTFAYGDRLILENLTVRMTASQLVAILGVNGSGKSTLLKNLNGLLQPKYGTVLVDGHELAAMSGRDVARHIGYMPQKTTPESCTVFDAVLLGRKPHITWKAGKRDLRIVTDTLHRLGLEDYALRRTTELSGGELQRVVIARALAQEPKILLLDEPISHLDIRNQLETMRVLKNITQEMQLTVVVVIHDLSMALRFADQFVLLKKGRLFAAGNRQIITAATIKEIYQINAEVFNISGIPVVVPTSVH
ncbi:ABC transporter ATP-binding protein [Desulfopila sp. IMCC35006]|uniref:ABC transporter ATP-binding protein n=1 Tax=Desulfopila sp. IMCC35006 TaxID=2569542 RepID=UPI0010AC51D5|nr:ABC transporter ATP-binding protein [Desulfopila sp. IMCC35006]TKB24490.1 ABC transporter ATP-binding protein [Desulfopila sp. IMCC35006]